MAPTRGSAGRARRALAVASGPGDAVQRQHVAAIMRTLQRMNPAIAQYGRRVLSGEARGVGPALLRAALAAGEPLYAAGMMARNTMYGMGVVRAHRLGLPVISVGNITTGGTGKTPIVLWLAGKLRERGLRPAVLLRGYRPGGAGPSDEQMLLEEGLNGPGVAPIPVRARGDRVAGGRELLRERPETNVLILDDGFQHRRLHRDFDLVLIDATEPFGYGHVHPRGLLREPLRGLGRADAFVLTRSDQVSAERRAEIEAAIRTRNPAAPVYRAHHRLEGLRSGEARAWAAMDVGLEALAGRRFFAFAGIANPRSLEMQLLSLPGKLAGHWWLADHHEYGEEDMREVRRRARDAGAEVLLTTEKDWMKVRRLASSGRGGTGEEEMPVWRLGLEIRFDPPGEEGLLDFIQTRVEKRWAGGGAGVMHGPVEAREIEE